MDPSELQANKQRKTQNHPAKTVREIKGQDLWQQEKLSCTNGRNAFIKEDKPSEVRYVAKQLLPMAMEGIFKSTFQRISSLKPKHYLVSSTLLIVSSPGLSCRIGSFYNF